MWFYDKDIEMSDLIDLFCSILLPPVSPLGENSAGAKRFLTSRIDPPYAVPSIQQ
jgi:hypothetical protein